MMGTIIAEKGITFKEFEKKTYEEVCFLGQQRTKQFLERYDKELMMSRDRSSYRHKGYRQTTIKTIYGEVTYKRAIYEVVRENGKKEFVFLLDETLQIGSVGLISLNVAEKLVSGITELSYKECAAQLSRTTGQTISPMGVWNVIQALGESVQEDEKALVRKNKAGELNEGEEIPVLFEETDGINLKLQKEVQKSAELKMGIAYDGWRKTGTNRYSLNGKVVTAGFAGAKEFQTCREAMIAEKYNVDEVKVRIMNADGAGWTKSVIDPETVFQLDQFHRNKAIRENIPYGDVINAAHDYLKEKDVPGLFRYLETYRDSLLSTDEIAKADVLITYLRNNADGLLPYKDRITLPESPKGLYYRDMGTMEGNNWAVIAKRMKGRHASWTIKGGNNLAKILAKKCSDRLSDVTAKMKEPKFRTDLVEKIEESILSAAKVGQMSGKGYEYGKQGEMPILYGATRGAKDVFLSLAGL